MNRLFSVITTIQAPTESVTKLYRRLAGAGTLVVAGDRKGPEDYVINSQGSGPTVQFLSLQDQLSGPFELGRKLPTDHYCRKNIGYLQAIAQGAECIYETDDDNAPLGCWKPRAEYIENARVVDRMPGKQKSAARWVNVYKYFTDENIWPRGLPLDEIRKPAPGVRHQKSEEVAVRAPIQQGLVNDSPDVDAIWRLVLDRPFTFDNKDSVYLTQGNWSPFNTQSTWWWPVAYPLLYIPSYCSFRMCDIWKSFVAQRCLWELDAVVAFHAPEVSQDRNAHNLIKDFRDEIPGYERNRELVEVLENLSLEKGEDRVTDNLRSCYQALIKSGFFPGKELDLVDAWLSDLAVVPIMGSPKENL